jgi:hypothetical protein
MVYSYYIIINNLFLIKMLPSVKIVKKKRSSSKMLPETTSSPYFESGIRGQKQKSLTMIKAFTPSINRKSLAEFPFPVRHLGDSEPLISIEKAENDQLVHKAEEFEAILHERLDKFKKNDSEYISELEVLDSVYFEVASFLKPFAKLFRTLRRRIEEKCYENLKEDFEGKIEKLSKERACLVAKINGLADMNEKLNQEIDKLKSNKAEFDRLLIDNPNFLITYKNIVEQMLEQVEAIKGLKKEVKRLKKIEALYQVLSQGNQSYMESFIMTDDRLLKE